MTSTPEARELLEAESPVQRWKGFTRGAATGGNRRRGPTDLKAALLFILPAAVGFIFFYVLPAIRGFYLSLTNYNLLKDPDFIGLSNYTRLLSDPIFWNSLKVTVYYVIINIVVQTAVAIGLALVMDRVVKRTLTKGVILLPYFIANVVVALVWYWMLDPQLGIVNKFIEAIGLSGQSWFGNPALVIPTIAFINVWRHMGYTALLIYAGLQTIPKSVYEAASIDGATASKQFFKITLPLLRPVITLVLIVSVVGSFQIFDTVAVTTHGGPGNASRVLQLYIYDQGFGVNNFGYASAISVVLFIILIIVAALQFRFLRGRESDLA
ncbi:MAG TPA: sugar ABC transporter permease [Nakamurella sp.]